ncbi:MAG: asparagine synthase (glutamine-hydrolyzing) [Aulosira sp. ZfuVER01]|nr:asparagine synthase (glutamine-hydrolyzing) [Aulosira sp. ZfuVER01]MDZ7998057.1 asparagine synthase (glutamine-hydrolyzing) [Aulosira sp. DedVER01a]MDZ8050451.1 asparagine synthase (glutamine-hydrolyzing) [Aulosira sp. ZfuCHP01]
MCGINGFWNISQQFSLEELQSIAKRMSNTLVHRGPDDGGIWVDAEAGIAFGHRRLAIVDLSPEGHQPMVSTDGRYVIVFNGEIYNFLELRYQLKDVGYHFRGHSDTEVMLASFSQWGLDGAVERFNGMFAFALWDRKERVLHLGRDRLGEKPLYYGWNGKTFLFGSELKALKAHPHFRGEINRDALGLFFRYNYIPAPYSIYQGLYKLPPGTTLTWDGKDVHPKPVAYWSAKKIVESGAAEPFTGSDVEAVAQLEELLQEAVGLRMVADVPLGGFLSGGIDSSTVIALMQAQSSQPVKTFTIGFYEDGYNEAPQAKAVAQHLGTDHTELYVTLKDALAVIPKLPIIYDEPFCDLSHIPTFLLSQLTRQHVTVSLSGDGGDELFAGYSHYFKGSQIWQKIGWIPSRLRQTAAHILTSLSPETWDRGLSHFADLLPAKLKQPTPGTKVHLLANFLAAANPEALHKYLASDWQQPEALVIGSSEPMTAFSDRQSWVQIPDCTQRMMYLDMVTYLPDDILVKVDRASMGVSLEARVPLLDHRVVELAWRMPMSMKIRNGQSKWLLRQILYKYVPQELIERPKKGFGVPIDSWLHGSLQDWAESLLDEHRLQQEGFLNPQLIRQKWAEYLAGDRRWKSCLWNALMFQSWLETNY